jgi:hypothetical protein
LNRLVDVLVLVVLGATVLCAVTPVLVRLMNALVPAVVVIGLVVVIVRALWYWTGRNY